MLELNALREISSSENTQLHKSVDVVELWMSCNVKERNWRENGEVRVNDVEPCLLSFLQRQDLASSMHLFYSPITITSSSASCTRTPP